MAIKYGVLDSPVDSRDYIYSEVCGAPNETFPVKFINKPIYVKDQKNSMKCVGFAGSSCMESKEIMRLGYDKIPMLSAQFAYYTAKTLDGLSSKVEGTTGKAMAEALYKYGICEDVYMPFVEKGDLLSNMVKPTPEAYENAKSRKIDGYAKVTSLTDIKRAVVQEGGCMVSMLYYADMMHPVDGYIAKPNPKSSKLGNHMKVIVGYDDEHEATVKGVKYKGFFVQLNSYGSSQGAFGLEYIPYDFLNWKGGIYEYSIDKIFREAWVFYDNTNIKNPDYFKENQPDVVIKTAKPIDMTLHIGSKQVTVNGATKEMDTAPILKNGSTFVPVRFIAEEMDCTVKYWKDGYGAYVNITDNNTGKKVDMTIGMRIAYVRGQEYQLNAPPFVENGRTYLPLRACAEMMDCKVTYENKTKKITIKRG